MKLVVDLQSAVTLEEQIRSGIRRLIALGHLQEGDALPSVRQLAGDLDVHWNTVARAYRGLETEGLLSIGRGRGVTVRAIPASNAAGRKKLVEELRRLFANARLLGFDTSEMRTLLLRELQAWSAKENKR
jgi:DNA-binding transcriptional regulator YhcF (GntR family)